MFTVKLKDGKSYKISEALAKSMEKAVEDGNDKVVYHDKLNGSFAIKMSDIESIG